MNETHSVESLIHRYISDHGLREGDLLPPQAELAEAFGCDLQALEAGLEAVLHRGEIASGPEPGQWVIRSPVVMADQESLSFSHSASAHGEKMDRIVREVALRGPRQHPEDPFTINLERKAHEALGLGDGEPFIIIERVQFLHRDGENVDPRVIHRIFLDPKRFPPTFLKDHDFATESMIHIYNQYGYTIEKRYDAMRARHASPAERIDLKIGLSGPVLDLEQRTMARQSDAPAPILLEYLRATYWKITFEFER